jgi:hypothetical protein
MTQRWTGSPTAGILLLVLAAAVGCVDAGMPPPANPGQPTCLMGADGRQACGYNCRLGADGQSACANTPDGQCALGADGHVVCSQVAAGAAAMSAPPPQCRMSSSGTNVCGYNCRYASNGEVACASRPDAQCAFNSDGTLTCP